MTITHNTVKTEGADNKYRMLFAGGEIGLAVKGKIKVAVGEKNKELDGFVFTPSAGFEKVGPATAPTMKDLKAALEKAVAAAGITAPAPAPKPSLPTTPVAAPAPVAGLAGGADGEIDL